MKPTDSSVQLPTLFLLVLVCGVSYSVNAQGQEDGCTLPQNIRPVVQINGFTSGILFDSADGYSIAFGLGGIGNATDLSLPLQWNDDLTQEASPLGPESSPDDALPGFSDPVNAQLRTEGQQLVAILDGWEEELGGNTTLFFPVGWDWRRDFYEQSQRVYDAVLAAKEETGCNPIVVGQSLGGLASYTAFTRFSQEFADNVHAVLYAVTPFTPLAAGAGVIATGFPGDSPDEPVFGSEELFSYPSFWALVNPLDVSCVNVPEEAGGEARECGEGQLDTGVSCEAASGEACGRPAEFPAAQFYLPIDLQDPATYDTAIVGLTAARALAGEPPVLSEEEKTHVEFVTRAAARVHEGTIGARAEEVAALHPPTITLSLTLGNITLPGLEEPLAFVEDTALECVVPEGVTEGNSSAPVCEFFGPARPAPTDGLLPSEGTFLFNSAAFGDKLQVLNATRPSDFWLKVLAAEGVPGLTPHAVALMTAVQPVDSFVNCSQYNETVTFGDGEYPALDDMLCSLVLQGNKAHAEEGTVGPAEAPSAGAADLGDGEPPSEGGDVTEVPSGAPEQNMHAFGWVAIASLVVTLLGVAV